MPVYAYHALNKTGKTIRGVVDADTPQKARQRLRADGLHPVEVKPAAKPESADGWRDRLGRQLTRRRNTLHMLTESTRQLATLLGAGLPLVTALATIQEQTEDRDLGRIWALVKEDINQGESMAGSISRRPDVFPMEYVHLVRAGEMAGELDTVLTKLAENLEQRMSRRARLASALAYPAFMLFIGSGVLFFVLSFIVPTLVGLFDSLGAALPWPTRLLLAVSGFFHSFWWAVIPALIIAVYLARRSLRNPSNFRRFELLLFRAGPFGVIYRKIKLAQVFRSLAVMVAGGVPLNTALAVAAQGLGRSSYAAALELAAEMVGEGRTVTEGFEASGLFPPVARRMIAVGESSGSLDTMMGRVAQSYEEETDRALSTLTSLVEPAIILVMGLLVGFVVISVLLPIFDLSGLVG